MDISILDKAFTELIAGQVVDPLDRVRDWLRDQRRFLTPADWYRVRVLTSSHALSELLRQDPLIGRSFRKPRGYPGDAVTMDMIYGIGSDLPSLEGFSAELFTYGCDIPPFRAVRYRRKLFSSAVDAVSARRTDARVASVGAGHAREAHGSTAVRSGALKSYFAVDQDLDSLHVAEKDYGVIPVHSSVRGICEQGSIAEQVDLILAGGLYDYLTERTAIPLTRCLIDSLAPGGVLHIANIVRGFGDAALLEAVMDWPLVHRDEQDMRALLSEVATDRIDTITLHRDPDDVMTFMEVHLR